MRPAKLFDELLLIGDAVQGTAMLLGYVEHDKNEDAIQFYPQMLVQGFLITRQTTIADLCWNVMILSHTHVKTYLFFRSLVKC